MKFNVDRRRGSSSWVLPKGQAQTFTPAWAGVLRVPSGRAWVTINRSRQCLEALGRNGRFDDDLFLDSTSSLPLRAGQTIVIESWSVELAADLTLVWEAAEFGTSTQRWQQNVAQPARELVHGLKQAGLAFAKMVQGLFGYTLQRVAHPQQWHCRPAD